MKSISNEIEAIISKYDTNKSTNVRIITAESYEKAAFSSYVLGRFEEAVKYQSKALEFNDTPEYRFNMAKYQVRIGKTLDAVGNINKSLDGKPSLAMAVFKEIDLLNEKAIVELLMQKNKDIDTKIIELADKRKAVYPVEKKDVLNELYSLVNMSYAVKIERYQKFIENEESDFIEKQVDDLIAAINKIKYFNLSESGFRVILFELERLKGLPLEEMKSAYESVKAG